MNDLSEIVEACNDAEIEPEPSLESQNAYTGEDVELGEEQQDAISRIVSEDN